MNIINTLSLSKKVAMVLGPTGIEQVCVISMKKMNRVCTTSLCTLVFPLFSFQSPPLELSSLTPILFYYLLTKT